MIPALIPYISRYYDDWRRSSRRWCSFLGILPDADDVLSDVLESLCRRPEAFQFDLLAREQAGERPLLFYVLGALRKEAIRYAQKSRITCSIERFPQLIENDGSDTEVSAELFAAFREVEAIFRSDDFIDAGLQYGGHGRLTRYVTRIKRKHGFYPTIKYQVSFSDGFRRQFSCRSSAIAFLVGRNPPPSENRTGNQLKRSNNNLLTNR